MDEYDNQKEHYEGRPPDFAGSYHFNPPDPVRFFAILRKLAKQKAEKEKSESELEEKV